MITDERLKFNFFHKSYDGMRYVPRSYNGGAGWGVFDRKESRFVDDEVSEIGEERLMKERFLQ